MSEVPTAPLAALQRSLARLYDLPPGPDVEGFVCSEEHARSLAPDDVGRGEVLLVHEHCGAIEVGLYVDPAALRVLATGEPGDAFGAYCLAAEGVSHFVYLAFRASQGSAVSQLELEVQGEVDKYATALLSGWGVGAFRERSRALRERLFAAPRYHDAPHTEAGARYREANRVAARYAAWLERRFVSRRSVQSLVGELRRYYRRGAAEKLRPPV